MPYAAHNTALLFAFASTLLGTWLLARRLSGNSAAAAVAAVLFAFCPYFFSHSAHIQLLMAGGIPLADARAASPGGRAVAGPRAGARRGAGGAGARLRVLRHLRRADGRLRRAVPRRISRRLWRARAFWTAVAIARRSPRSSSSCRSSCRTSICSAKKASARSLDDARPVFRNAGELSRVAGARAPAGCSPLARQLGWRCGEVLFPGVLAIVLGAAGVR